MEGAFGLAANRAELRRYVRRVGDRWQLEAAYLCPVSLLRHDQTPPDANRVGSDAGSGSGNPAHAGADSAPAKVAVLASGPSTALTSPGEDSPRFVVVLVSEAFDEVPWLERVHIAEALWDADEMGASAELHCYTAIELVRKQRSLEAVRHAVEQGVDLLSDVRG